MNDMKKTNKLRGERVTVVVGNGCFRYSSQPVGGGMNWGNKLFEELWKEDSRQWEQCESKLWEKNDRGMWKEQQRDPDAQSQGSEGK